MSSHLSVSYAGPPTASSTPAAAAAGDAPAADSPLGFLAALIDQLLAGGTTVPAPADATPLAAAQPAAGIAPVAPFLPQTQASVPAPAKSLLDELTKDLQALRDQLDPGETPDPDLLDQLGQAADALAAMIAVPNPLAPPTAPAADLDPLQTIEAASAASPAAPAASTPAPQFAESKSPGPLPADQATLLLASLGVTAPASGSGSSSPAAPEPATAPAATSTQPLPALAELGNKLADLAAAIAPLAPEIAKKLENLTGKIASAELDPALLSQLTAASDSDGKALDAIVRGLLDSKPAPAVPSTPQLATTTQLPLPATQPDAPVRKAETTAIQPPDPPADPVAPVKPTVRAVSTDAQATTPVPPEPKPAAAIAQADPTPDRVDATTPTATGIAPATPAAVAPRAIPAAYQAAANPINMGQVAFEMVRQVHQGSSRFSIRLDPPELGRVDVRMHVDATGAINARLTVERAETLDMFQRDKGTLEKALNQAGLDSGKTNLEFSLRQNPFAGMTGGDQRPSGGASAGPRFALAADDDPAAVPAITLYRGVASAGGVNLFV